MAEPKRKASQLGEKPVLILPPFISGTTLPQPGLGLPSGWLCFPLPLSIWEGQGPLVLGQGRCPHRLGVPQVHMWVAWVLGCGRLGC